MISAHNRPCRQWHIAARRMTLSIDDSGAKADVRRSSPIGRSLTQSGRREATFRAAIWGARALLVQPSAAQFIVLRIIYSRAPGRTGGLNRCTAQIRCCGELWTLWAHKL